MDSKISGYAEKKRNVKINAGMKRPKSIVMRGGISERKGTKASIGIAHGTARSNVTKNLMA